MTRQFGGILRASSGFPLTITSGVDQSRTAHGYDRPNVVGGVISALPSDQRSPAEWFNVSAFQMNPLGTFGNVGRSTVMGPGIFVVDFSAICRYSGAASSYRPSEHSTCA